MWISGGLLSKDDSGQERDRVRFNLLDQQVSSLPFLHLLNVLGGNLLNDGAQLARLQDSNSKANYTDWKESPSHSRVFKNAFTLEETKFMSVRVVFFGKYELPNQSGGKLVAFRLTSL